MFAVRNVVEDAGGEHKVKGIVGERQYTTVEHDEIRLPGVAPTADRQALPGDIQAYQAGSRQQCADMRDGVAHPCAKV